MKIYAILSALAVAFCWGMYGSALANARSSSDSPVTWGPFKPYIFVGMAYLVVAIIGGSLMMKFVFKDSFDYSGGYAPARTWGFLAGCLGAFGAFFLTLAVVKARGNAAYVMPVVFGGAVTVNAIASYFNLPPGQRTDPRMWIGMLLVAVGVVLTAKFTPHGHAAKKPQAAVEELAAPGGAGGTQPAPAVSSESADSN